ncbi:MAG: type I CRISPR-associated protein Cas7 [Planctomycetes bacterium]|nr:type I CRISPR-associated protein Cas7 [Planctomycetota bacterium]
MTEQLKDEKKLSLHHNLVQLPKEKRASDVVGERHDMVLLIECSKSNPNGDPDTGNMPRMQPDTLKGLMTDVCLKRKVRNFFSLYNPDGTRLEDDSLDGYRMFIREGAVLQQQIEDQAVEGRARSCFTEWVCTEVQNCDAIENGFKQRISKIVKGESATNDDDKKFVDKVAKRYRAAWEGGKRDKEQKEKDKPEDRALAALDKILKNAKERRERAWRDALCAVYIDTRAFGGVVSTEGPLKGSFYGQIRGPIQMSFAESLDRVLPLDFSITRCASSSEDEDATSEGEEGGNRTMGRKHIVDYAVYRCQIYFSPAFAARTGFTYYDLDNFLFALTHMFTDDKAAPRTGMRVVGLVDFQHSTALGNEHAHKLFEMVKVVRTDAVDPKTGRRKDFPQSIKDYAGTFDGMKFGDGSSGSKVPIATVREKDEGGGDKGLVIARKVVWDIPEKVLT